MDLHLLVIDDFLSKPIELRKWALLKGFKEEISPADGLKYKGVCKDVPWIFQAEVEQRLNYMLHATVETKLSFVRMSLEDLSKRWIHVDPMYSRWVCIVYLNEEFPSDAGTRMFSHPDIDLFDPNGLTEDKIKLWDKLCNKPKKWKHIGEIPMKFNRAAVYDTRIFHAPVPRDGFGKVAKHGRMVYVTFFN